MAGLSVDGRACTEHPKIQRKRGTPTCPTKSLLYTPARSLIHAPGPPSKSRSASRPEWRPRQASPLVPRPGPAKRWNSGMATLKGSRGPASPRPSANVNGEINQLLSGRSWKSLEELDGAVVELDGTENKSRLGANATVGVSMAAARAMASADGTPLYRWLAADESLLRLPVPNFNVINGGAHAQNDLEFQEFMLSPLGAPNFAEALRAGSEVYLALRALLHAKGHSTGLGDEGGFAPDLGTPGGGARPPGGGNRGCRLHPWP